MKKILSALVVTALALPYALSAEDTLDPAQIQTFRPYQLDKCLVSGDKIGAMGEGLSMVYKGQEITFCCKMCVKMFAKKPAHFLAEMTKAEAAKTHPEAETEKPKMDHDGHGHH